MLKRPRIIVGLAFLIFALAASAQQMAVSVPAQPQNINFTLTKVFIFLFLTLGPLKLLGPFAQMTRGCDAAARRNLAFRATVISIVAIVFAAVTGASILTKWGISLGSLLLTAGLILFLVALKPVMEQFAQQSRVAAAPAPDVPLPTPMRLAFPTIVTPYGIAILIVLVTLRGDTRTAMQVLGVAVFVLLLDFIAMLFAQRILGTPLVPLALGIVEPVMGVLQVALGVSAVVRALSMLGFKT
jgi:multiple antibiotic resistance protein